MSWLTPIAFIQIREDVKKGVHVENLTEHEISNAREALQQLIEVNWWNVIISGLLVGFEAWISFISFKCNQLLHKSL